ADDLPRLRHARLLPHHRVGDRPRRGVPHRGRHRHLHGPWIRLRLHGPLMRAVVQRVSRASVTVDGDVIGRCGPGLLILLGVAPDDGGEQVSWLATKVSGLRLFSDDDGKMNRSLLDDGRSALVVSQFTLYADTRRGRRPGFSGAA